MRKQDKNELPLFELTMLPISEGSSISDGFDKIAFVDNPAMEEMGVFLEKADKRVVPSELIEDEIIKYLKTCGRETKPESWNEMSESDYEEVAGSTTILELTKDPSARESRNDITDKTGEGQWLVRYEYQGPRDSKNRKFCSKILSIGRIYTEEEIKNGLSNSEFGNYSIWDYKGSYGCRHRWARKIYFENYEKDTIKRSYLAPAYVKSGLGDSEATRRNLSSHFKLENTEKQQVVAPLMIPDKIIYRDDKNGEYNIKISREAIIQLRDKASEEGKLTDLNVLKDTHKGAIVTAFILEEWIIEDENDKAYTEYGFDINKVPIGTWMVTTQILDKDFWENEIKKNKKFAYSIEAFFNMRLINLNINKNKESTMDKEKTELAKTDIEILTDELKAIEEKIAKAKESEVKPEEKVEAVEDKDADKVEEKVEAVEDKDADKVEEKVEAIEDKDADKVEEKVEAIEEEAEESTEEVADEAKETEDLDSKFETVFEEIAKIKAMISEMGSESDSKVEMSTQRKSSLIESLGSLAKVMSKK